MLKTPYFCTLLLFLLFAPFGFLSRLPEESGESTCALMKDNFTGNEQVFLKDCRVEVFSETSENYSSPSSSISSKFDNNVNVQNNFDFKDDPSMQEFLRLFQAERPHDSCRIRRKGKSEFDLNLKRSEMYTELLKLYRQEIDSTANQIYWEKARIINFPIAATKTKSEEWTCDDLVKLEKGLPSIRFEKIPFIVKSAPANMKRIERVKAIKSSLLKLYQTQINPRAKVTFRKNVRMVNYPNHLLGKTFHSWTNNDLDLLESLLPYIYFEKIDRSKDEASSIDKSDTVVDCPSSSRKHNLNESHDSSPVTAKRQRADESELIFAELEEFSVESIVDDENVSFESLFDDFDRITLTNFYQKLNGTKEKFRFLSNIFLEMYQEATESTSEQIKWKLLKVSGWPEGLLIKYLKKYNSKELDLLYQSLPNISFEPNTVNAERNRRNLYNELLTSIKRFPAFNYRDDGINWRKVHEEAPELKLKYVAYMKWSADDCEQVRNILINGLIPRLEAQKSQK